MENKLSPTQLAIITLLHAKDKKGELYSSIPGYAHIVKEIFTIRQTDLGAKILKELNFEPDNFGPFDETIYAALDSLKEAGYVKIISKGDYSQISLSEKGKSLSDQLWGKLKPDITGLFTYVKMNYNHLSTVTLLERIYRANREMTVNSISKVAKRIRQESI